MRDDVAAVIQKPDAPMKKKKKILEFSSFEKKMHHRRRELEMFPEHNTTTQSTDTCRNQHLHHQGWTPRNQAVAYCEACILSLSDRENQNRKGWDTDSLSRETVRGGSRVPHRVQ